MNPLEWEKEIIEAGIEAPASPGCYALIDQDKTILYIGRSKLLCNRINHPYKHKAFTRLKQPLNKLMIAWKTGWEIYDKEKDLILKYKPPLCVYHLSYP